VNLRFLQRAPFRLDPRALAWVKATFTRLTVRQQCAQLIVPLALDTSDANLERFTAAGFGGLFRMQSRGRAALRAEAARIQAESAVPMLLCGDLEFGEQGAIGGAEGTAFPNQLAVAAAGGRAVERMAAVAAAEGRSAGFNWSFTPVGDLDFNPLNPVVSTRSFGNDPARVAPLVRRYIRELQRAGLAACLKHWPGDGVDDRDQHHVTSVNGLAWAAWNRTYGRVYRAGIGAGAWSIMAGHIALPAWRGAELAPASLSRELNIGLLRGRLGFNGVIVSDASCMAGLTAHVRREMRAPQLIGSGCDVVLFPDDPEFDVDCLARARARGELPAERVSTAVLRVLALKAALGLHRSPPTPPRPGPATRPRHRRWAEATAQAAVTLVRDEAGLLPLVSSRHRRILLIEHQHRRSWAGPLPDLQIEGLLKREGFRVTRWTAEEEASSDRFDLALYVVAQEAGPGRTSLGVPWQELMGDFRLGMVRTWPDLPTVFVSLGYPWHGRELTGCPTVINAYSPVPAMQSAVVAALVGRAPMTGRSPVRFEAADTLVRETTTAGSPRAPNARSRGRG